MQKKQKIKGKRSLAFLEGRRCLAMLFFSTSLPRPTHARQNIISLALSLSPLFSLNRILFSLSFLKTKEKSNGEQVRER